MSETTTKQVRQLLANELGLTREAVREVITERIDNLLKGIDTKAIFADVAERCVTRAMKKHPHDYASVQSAFHDVCKEVIRERLKLELKP